MSHAIYQTTALILKTKNMRESNKLVYLYTKKFGLIYASMQSLRELKSKMRYHVHNYALVDVDVVAGRNIWRITGIHERQNAFQFSQTQWYRLLSLLADTLIRLCPGEEENEYLWDILESFFVAIASETEPYEKEYEIIILVLIFHALGYWNENDYLLQSDDYYSEMNIVQVQNNKFEYIKKINESFTQSQL